MNFFKRLTLWGWAEIIFFLVVIGVDNFHTNADGFWVTLLIVGFSAIDAIADEAKYSYAMPVNYPEQSVTDKEILSNFIRSWLGLFICLAPILYGPIWIKVLAVLTAILAGYAVVVSHRLFSFTQGDVKYEG